MRIEDLINTDKRSAISGVFNIDCSEGSVDGRDEAKKTITDAGCEFEINEKNFSAKTVIKKCGDVFIRKDFFTNTSDKSIILYRYYSRFTINESDVSVYAQYSNWANENKGSFEKLTNTVSVCSRGVRSTSGGTPFVSVWRENANRGLAFNLIANAVWKISVEKKPVLPLIYNAVVIEAGIADDRLRMEVMPGETINLPELMFYDFDNKTDMGQRKLHEYFNEKYKRKSLPVIYNSWFSNFDDISFESFAEQAKRAAKLGCEYFVVDAGWFGCGKSWAELIGDWSENLTGGLMGRTKELADLVRSLGMKFGIWLEPERALAFTKIVKEHPEYFICESGNYFIDFANDKAREYITNTAIGIAKKYGAEFFKFDFNADCLYDNRNSSFYRYNAGHEKFIADIREAIPGIYIENCASGGTRADLYRSTYFDGIWFSDNQNPYDGTKIIREALYRLPPSFIERWAVLKSVDSFTHIYSKDNKTTRLLTVKGATWQRLENVSMEYIKMFLSGGAAGFTCNLNDLMDEDIAKLREYIKIFKEKRDFYANASCTLLVSNESYTVWQYALKDESRIVLQAFAHEPYQRGVYAYPKLVKNQNYASFSAKELCENGVWIALDDFDMCGEAEFCAE